MCLHKILIITSFILFCYVTYFLCSSQETLYKCHSVGNPVQCGCSQQEVWYWLQDHQKLVDRGPRCEDPPHLRALWFLGLEPPEFCSLPLISRLALEKIQATSLALSWDSQDKSGLTGFMVAHHTLENPSEVSLVIASSEFFVIELSSGRRRWKQDAECALYLSGYWRRRRYRGCLNH